MFHHKTNKKTNKGCGPAAISARAGLLVLNLACFLLLLPPGAVAGSNSILRISVDEAVWTGLSNNRSLHVERLTPAIRREREELEHARFGAGVSGALSAGRESAATRPAIDAEVTSQWSDIGLEAERSWVSGTRVGLEAGLRITETGDDLERHALRMGLTVTQSLLRGGGVAVNRIGIRQAEIETRVSLYELYGFTAELVARIEKAYWQLALAERNVSIVRESADLASRQLLEVEKRIEAGMLAAAEIAAARSEQAMREGALIRALGDLERAGLRFLHLVNPPVEQLWDTTLQLTDQPPGDMPPPDGVNDHAALALRKRPELQQARMALERGDLEIKRTRNGMLPRLDLFVRFGRTAYADSFGASLDAVGDETPDLSAGLRLTHTPGRHAARADYRASLHSREQLAEAVANLEQLVELDVRLAHIETRRADDQARAAAATHAAQQETLRAETEKFQVGRSTVLAVARAQRDLMAAKTSETEAQIAALIARINLYHLDGSLLDRRGIAAPDGM